MSNKDDRGNILFLILLAVVLFAALSYAVTSSLRGGGKNASSEKAEAQASELLNYFAQIDTTVQRMMLIGNVKDYELDFTNPLATAMDSWSVNHNGYGNPNCTVNNCRVFHPSGGGAVSRQFPGISKSLNAGNYMPYVIYQTANGAGTDKADMVMYFRDVKDSVCRAINNKIGYDDIITGLSYATLTATNFMYGSGTTWSMGSFPDTTASMTGIPFDAGSKGTFCGCALATVAACEASNTNNIIYHIVVAR